MNPKTVTLPREMWDKIIELVDDNRTDSEDKEIVLYALHNQLEGSPADQPLSYPHKIPYDPFDKKIFAK